MRYKVVVGFLTSVLTAPLATAAEPRQADVLVYGGTAGGVIAAVAAAREGKGVVVLEPGKHVGGMVSGGLGATDFGNRACIGGYSREFFDRVRSHYVKKYGADAQQVKDCSDGFHFEPHVAEQVFNEMLQEAKVEVLLGRRLKSAAMSGPHITGVVVLNKDGVEEEFRAGVFVDASYEGDLMAAAKVKYVVGREGRADYNESLAGVQEHSPAHQWPVPVSPFAAGDRLLPFVQPGPIEKLGAGDRKVQAYNFRLCMTDRKDNMAPFPKPDGYDPARYELLARYLAKKPGLKVGQLMNPVRMPNGKTDTNNNGPFSTDHIGANWDYPEADAPTRQKIWKDHEDYVKGFLYFLANDPRVPAALHDEMNGWGLAKDEFTDNGNWPHQLYVREARRMKGEYFMTQLDVMEKRTKDDSVGLGSYNTDSHHVQRVPTADGAVLNEGDFQVKVSPYAIPYRSLTPKAEQCDNLLVPVCCSASHVAYGTIRMEPVYMILGQASGVAAALALDGKTAVQKVAADRLTAKLKVQKAVLSPDELPAAPAAPQRIDPAKLPGIVVDDEDAVKTGDWKRSQSVGPFVGAGYLHDDNAEKGKLRVRFVPKLKEAGKYEVLFWYTNKGTSNRATNTPVLVHAAKEEKKIVVNQRQPPRDGPLSLGVFEFAAGEEGYVEVGTAGTDGYVVVDAVQLVPMK